MIDVKQVASSSKSLRATDPVKGDSSSSPSMLAKVDCRSSSMSWIDIERKYHLHEMLKKEVPIFPSLGLWLWYVCFIILMP